MAAVDAVDGVQVRLAMGGQRYQDLKLSHMIFCGDILRYGLLPQAGDMLQADSVLVPL